MKILGILLTLFLFTVTIWAVPSDATVRKQANRIKPTKPFSIKFSGHGVTQTVDYRTSEYLRGAYLKFRTKYKGITRNEFAQVIYKKIGNGKWRFDRFSYYENETSYIGLRRPKEKELVSLIKNNLERFVGYLYNDIVGEVTNIKISKKSKWVWSSLKSGYVNFEADFSVKRTATLVEKIHITRTVIFKRETKLKGPLTKILNSRGNEKSISKKTYTQEEADKMLSLREAGLQKKIDDVINKLPIVKIPEFKLYDEFVYYIHDRMLNASKEEMESILYYNLDKRHFMGKPKFYFTVRGAKLFDRIMSLRDKYKKSFCKYPKVRQRVRGTGEIKFHSKVKNHLSSINVYFDKKSKSWKIIDIKMYEANLDIISYVEAQTGVKKIDNPGACDDKPTIIQPFPIYKVGDTVSYKVGKKLYYGRVIATDSIPNRYKIEFEKIRTMYGFAKDMKKVDESKVPKSKEIIEFAIEDRITVEFQNGSHDGNVKKINKRAGKMYVDFDDISDAWIQTKNCKKSSSKAKLVVSFKLGDKVMVKFRTKSFPGVIKKLDKRNKKVFIDFKRIKDIWVNEVHCTVIK